MLRTATLICTFLFTWFQLQAQVKFNGTFENIDKSSKKPAGWNYTFDKEQTFKVGLDSLIKKQKKHSISITAQEGQENYGAIKQTINHTFQGKNLTLLAYIKTENVTDGFAGLWMKINGPDHKHIGYENMEKNGITGTNDWKVYYIQLPYDEKEAISIDAGALLVGKGKMWVDSLALYMDDKPIDQAKIIPTPSFAGVKDTAFSKHSGINSINLTKKNIHYLNLLGQLWGFLKYHHPVIAKGDYNWDAELFRILPELLKSKTDKEAAILFENWIDKLGLPAPCANCIKAPDPAIVVKPDYGILFTNKLFPESLKNKLKFILANQNNDYNYYVKFNKWIENPEFLHEKPYPNMLYPDAGFRLLTLYRYWSAIQYFFPSRDLITEDWATILAQQIPEFVQAENQTDFAKALTKTIASIHDTHAFIQYSEAVEEFKGRYRVPFQAKFIEDKLVVTGFYKEDQKIKSQLKIGDIIISINGKKLPDLVKTYLPYTVASNYDTKLRDMPGDYLLRNNNPEFTFEVLRGSQKLTETITGLTASTLNSYSLDFNRNPINTAYSIMDNNIGFLFAGKYKNQDLNSMKEKFADTKGIIVDLRCYPSDDMMYTFGNYIKPVNTPFVKFTKGSLNLPGSFVYTDELKNGNKSNDNYKGKVVVLVNSITQSNAEFVAMALQSNPNVTVIGSTTSGADGNVSRLVLPGGIVTYISGLGVFYPDGTNAQRKGVKIDYPIKPTIKGIKEGKDEVLDKAVEIILKASL